MIGCESMRLKSKDIAKYLGVSPATVSLALNNKPGVKEETRKKIFDYIESYNNAVYVEAEEARGTIGKIRAIVYVGHEKIISDTTLNLLPGILAEIEREARSQGFENSIVYFYEGKDDVKDLINSCIADQISGVILFATEMHNGDLNAFKKMDIPILIYDNDFDEMYFDSIVINNRLAVKVGMDYLAKSGLLDVVYFYNSSNIYNFSERRIGFLESSKSLFQIDGRKKMIEMGTEIDEIYDNVTHYFLKEKNLPQAIFCENYSVSVGTVTALKDLKYKIPENISIIGIDEIPKYLMKNLKLTCVKVLHLQRATAAVKTLIKRITSKDSEPGIVMSFAPILIEGDSVLKS